MEAVAVRKPSLGNSAGAELGWAVRADLYHRGGQGTRYAPDWSVKVVCYRKQTVGLQFPKDTAQSLLHPIYGVEESSAIQLEFLAAQLPVRAQEEMTSENLVLELGQSPFADETEVGRKLFVFAAPCASAVFTRQRVKRHFAHEFLPAEAVAKMLKALPEDGS
jgi:hypothetical protein